mmetsp:Transcript_33855/g.70377  ORF Transcript_33855/g.70377 Transcript_33855/m.70377 type:complete len:113 (-) Transcript_33855:1663-2001(-)
MVSSPSSCRFPPHLVVVRGERSAFQIHPTRHEPKRRKLYRLEDPTCVTPSMCRALRLKKKTCQAPLTLCVCTFGDYRANQPKLPHFRSDQRALQSSDDRDLRNIKTCCRKQH